MENQTDPIQALVQQIDALLEKNGEVTQKTKDVLMFSVVKALLIMQKEQKECNELVTKSLDEHKDRIEVLERRNIATWCMGHPKFSLVAMTLLGMLVIGHYGSVVLNLLGIKLP